MASSPAFGDRSGDRVRRVRIDPRYTDAVLFDLDGVITDTAGIHQAVWAQMFDEYLGTRSPSASENHGPFTAGDYRHFVDGKARYDGVRDFLASRGVTLPWGSAADGPSAPTVSKSPSTPAASPPWPPTSAPPWRPANDQRHQRRAQR